MLPNNDNRSKQSNFKVQDGYLFILIAQDTLDIVSFQQVDGPIPNPGLPSKDPSFLDHRYLEFGQAAHQSKGELLSPLVLGHLSFADLLSIPQHNFGGLLLVVGVYILQADYLDADSVEGIELFDRELLWLTQMGTLRGH